MLNRQDAKGAMIFSLQFKPFFLVTLAPWRLAIYFSELPKNTGQM
jgi:hypothetical protein